MKYEGFPAFSPHPLLRSGHAQTLAGAFLPSHSLPYRAVKHRVDLPDGDAVILHDDCPNSWRPGERVVLLMHGLAGCHQSGYMRRVSSKLHHVGIRSFRMDLRGCGAGEGLARHPYHAGRTDDVSAVLRYVDQTCPSSPVCVIGFSLSGAVVLSFLGTNPDFVPAQLDRAMVVNPSIDLQACVEGLNRPTNRMYDRHFVKLLDRKVQKLSQFFPDFTTPSEYGHPRRLFDFDDRYTAPISGFASAQHYYSQCSANRVVAQIRTRTMILAAHDDPLVPVVSFKQLDIPDQVSLHVTEHGGHLGFIAKRGADPDRRWLDWRIVDWVTSEA